MVNKNFSVTLDDNVVERAKQIIKKYSLGSKLSPLLNRLLVDWCDKQEEEEN